MKNKLLFFALLLSSLIAISQNSQPLTLKNNSDYIPETTQNDTILKLFKTTQLGKTKVSLRQNIEELKEISVKDPNNFYHFKKDSYGVADSIWVEVNKSKQIIAIYFSYDYAPEYSNDTAYIHELHKYQKIISPNGKEFVYTSQTVSYKITKWEYKTVRFELIEVNKAGKKRTYSVIFDNELYFQKLNGYKGNKSETSIELLRLGLN